MDCNSSKAPKRIGKDIGPICGEPTPVQLAHIMKAALKQAMKMNLNPESIVIWYQVGDEIKKANPKLIFNEDEPRTPTESLIDGVTKILLLKVRIFEEYALKSGLNLDQDLPEQYMALYECLVEEKLVAGRSKPSDKTPQSKDTTQMIPSYLSGYPHLLQIYLNAMMILLKSKKTRIPETKVTDNIPVSCLLFAKAYYLVITPKERKRIKRALSEEEKFSIPQIPRNTRACRHPPKR